MFNPPSYLLFFFFFFHPLFFPLPLPLYLAVSFPPPSPFPLLLPFLSFSFSPFSLLPSNNMTNETKTLNSAQAHIRFVLLTGNTKPIHEHICAIKKGKRYMFPRCSYHLFAPQFKRSCILWIQWCGIINHSHRNYWVISRMLLKVAAYIFLL